MQPHKRPVTLFFTLSPLSLGKLGRGEYGRHPSWPSRVKLLQRCHMGLQHVLMLHLRLLDVLQEPILWTLQCICFSKGYADVQAHNPLNFTLSDNHVVLYTASMLPFGPFVISEDTSTENVRHIDRQWHCVRTT